MKQSRSAVAGVIAKKVLKSGNSRSYSQQIAAYLLSERRTGELSSLMRDVQEEWATCGHIEVIASSAHPLSPEIKADITDQIKNYYPKAKRVIVTETTDPDIIGGVRLSLANQQLDLSLQAKLHKFKQLVNTGKD